MTLPANLFIDSPEMIDPAMEHLDQNVESWPETIIQKIKERIPRSAGMSTLIKFMKKEPETGTATGSILITSGEKAAVVPLIIKDFMMNPLDVMIADGKLLPLTPDYFDSIFSETAAFQDIEEYPTFGGLGRFEDANLWNAVYPPSLGRYAYASAGYPILDSISESIDGSSLKKELLDNPTIAANFYKNGQAEIIKKVANLRPVNMNEFRQGKDNLLNKSVVMLKLDGPNKYTLLSNADPIFSPSISPMNRCDIVREVSEISDHVEDEINDVDQNGEKLLAAPAHDDVVLAKPDVEKIEMAEHFDHYLVKNMAGVSFEGIVIPMVINFTMAIVPQKIFISRTMSTIQPDIAGVRIRNSRVDLKGETPKLGQTGTFVYQPDKSHALATIPITIESLTSGPGGLSIRAMDLMGQGFNLKFNSDMELKRIVTLTDHYLLPSDFKWIPMEGFGQITNSAIDYAAKGIEDFNAKYADQKKATIIPTGYGQYSVKGLNKYAQVMGSDPTNLKEYEVKFILASLGCSHEKIGGILKHAHRRLHADVYGLNYLPVKEDLKAGEEKKASAWKKLIGKIKINLIKEASVLENSQTVEDVKYHQGRSAT